MLEDQKAYAKQLFEDLKTLKGDLQKVDEDTECTTLGRLSRKTKLGFGYLGRKIKGHFGARTDLPEDEIDV